MATTPLLTTAELEVWAQLGVGELTDDPFAIAIIGGASLIVREAGNMLWTSAIPVVLPDIACPERAKLIAILKAKAYYLNPIGAKSETTGPLSQTLIDDVVHSMTLTDTERTVLAALAGLPDPLVASGGLWVQPVSSGDGTILADDFYAADAFGSDWEIPFVRLGDHLYPREL